VSGGTELLTIDAFTDAPWGGNPAAVALLDGPADDAWMRSVAAEMNLAETAFVVPPDAHGVRGLRWFTPTVEVDLCGHATLATAHALWSTGRAPAGEPLRFSTRSGELRAVPDGDLIALDLPTNVPAEGPVDPDLLDALGVLPTRTATAAGDWVLVEVATEAEVRSATPDLRRLAAHPMVILTAAASTAPFDVASRVFGPKYGIDEDPVTGSAHCILAPWWAPRLGRDEVRFGQVSTRGGDLRVRLEGDRTIVAGRAVTVLRAELLH
jgi:PhzF family phenazine biosynthesis protein